MNTKQQIEQFIDGLRKVLFYVGHGKYNDYMSLEEVNTLKAKLEIILEIEKDFEKAITSEEIEAIYERIKPFENCSAKDFIEMEITKI